MEAAAPDRAGWRHVVYDNATPGVTRLKSSKSSQDAILYIRLPYDPSFHVAARRDVCL